MSRKKFFSVCTLILIIIFNLLFTVIFFHGATEYSENWIHILSFFTVIEIVISIYLWKKVTGELMNAFLLTFICADIFCLGQTWGWAFNISLGEKDLLTYVPHIDIKYIGDGIIYTTTGLMLFMLGGILSYKRNNKMKMEDTYINSIDYSAMKILSTLLIVVAIPFSIAYFGIMIPAIYSSGYLAFYEEIENNSVVVQIVQMISGWLPIALMMKYALYAKKNKTYKWIITFFIGMYIVLVLYLGGRSGAVTIALAFLLTNHLFNKPINRKRILPYALGGYLGLTVLNAVRDVRVETGRSVTDLFGSLFTSVFTVIGDFLGELGWSMSSLSWTMQLVQKGDFRHGLSYLFSVTAIIPNLGFWKVHPAKLYSNLGEWMQERLGRTSGLGYTFVAESYMNFGWGGLIVLLILGFIIGRWFGAINRDNAKYNILYSFSVIIAIDTLLKSFVRSSFSAIMRNLFYTLVILVIGAILIRKSIIARDTEKHNI